VIDLINLYELLAVVYETQDHFAFKRIQNKIFFPFLPYSQLIPVCQVALISFSVLSLLICCIKKTSLPASLLKCSKS
jgi:hypothetical protein